MLLGGELNSDDHDRVFQHIATYCKFVQALALRSKNPQSYSRASTVGDREHKKLNGQ
jgi:hypothetical protein